MSENAKLSLLQFAAKTAGVTPEQAEEVLETIVANLGWPEIHAMQAELRRGQDIYEDAGGFFIRAYRMLFGLPRIDWEIQNYQQAVRTLLKDVAQPADGGK